MGDLIANTFSLFEVRIMFLSGFCRLVYSEMQRILDLVKLCTGSGGQSVSSEGCSACRGFYCWNVLFGGAVESRLCASTGKKRETRVHG